MRRLILILSALLFTTPVFAQPPNWKRDIGTINLDDSGTVVIRQNKYVPSYTIDANGNITIQLFKIHKPTQMLGDSIGLQNTRVVTQNSTPDANPTVSLNPAFTWCSDTAEHPCNTIVAKHGVESAPLNKAENPNSKLVITTEPSNTPVVKLGVETNASIPKAELDTAVKADTAGREITLSNNLLYPDHCYPMIFTVHDSEHPNNKDHNGDVLILNADGSFYVNWPGLEYMASLYTTHWTTVGDFDSWTILQAVLHNRTEIKTVSLDQATEIAHLAAIRGDCIYNTPERFMAWPLNDDFNLSKTADIKDGGATKSQAPTKK